MEGILEINVSIYAIVLNPVKLASDEGYWIVSLADELVDSNIVPTDANVWWSCLGGYNDVAANWTVRWK